MNTSVLSLLSCPICHKKMDIRRSTDKICYCKDEPPHCFDFSRSGYLNLAGPHAGEGDGKQAIVARKMFLDAGYYQPLADQLCQILDQIPSQTLLDAGCGEGYYTNQMAKGRYALGIDLSKSGIDQAAKRARQTESQAGFAVASIFDLPADDAIFDVVTNLFAPCSEEEFLRILKPGGHLVIVAAGKQHLFGLKKLIYDDPYVNPGRADLPSRMKLIDKIRLHDNITVYGVQMIQSLFSMTPYYWRTSSQDRQKLESVESLTTEIDFDIYLYQKESFIF